MSPCHASSSCSVEADVCEVIVFVVKADWLGEWEHLLCNIGAAEFNLTQHGDLCVCVCVCA